MAKLVGELKAQVDENCEEKEQLQAIWNQYDQQHARYTNLESENRSLAAQAAQAGGAVDNSKQRIMGLLSQKANAKDSEARACEKQFLRGEIDMRAFLDQYVSKRGEYHKYQILKVKVN